jgi:hypothetical protein
MSILGKLLIVFNLLAAGAFAYFTLANWKVRKELTWAAMEGELRLTGIPVEAPAVPPADLGDDRVPFKVEVAGTIYDSIDKSRYEKLLPPGEEFFKGGPVADQQGEIKRLQGVVIQGLPAAGDPRFNSLHLYLQGLARTGAERDGVNALFDLRIAARFGAARRDLPLLGRTSSQAAALRTLLDIADLGDPQAIMPDTARTSRIALARESVRRFLLGEVPHGVAGTGDKAEAERNLTNAVTNALTAPGEQKKSAITAAATGDSAGWAQLATVAVEPLNDKPSCDRAIAALLAFVQGKAVVPTESAALAGVKELISPPPIPGDMNKTIDSVAVNLLNAKFDEAALPTGKGYSPGAKARKIAHVLYHIDAWRHANKDAAVVAARKAWHERVAAVVGLPEYIRAAEAQATEYAEASQRLVAVISEEQSAFEAEYQSQLQRVLFLYSQWLALDGQLKAQEIITNENVRLKDERLTERDKLREELKDWTEKAKNALAKLKTTQQRLFAIQRDLRNAHAAILALEKQLRDLELPAKGAKDGTGQ